MTTVFAVIAPGPLTTVQDAGRGRFLHMGVPLSGALDPFACRVANRLVGNPDEAAVLEMTFAGPHLRVLDEVDLAVTGADMVWSVNGVSAPCWRTVRVGRGDVVRFGQARSGCRGYLAVTGGVDVPMVLGSRSTCLSGRLGGIEGRPLRKGDRIARGAGELLKRARRLPDPPVYGRTVRLRAVPGPQDECFQGSLDLFFEAVFQVTPRSDRMGCRLNGPVVQREEGAPQGIVSEPSLPGNVQVPPDGRPIVLLVEQTMGGYTKIATVISPDLSRIAQARPGDTVRFDRVTIEEAHAACREAARRLAGIDAFLTSPVSCLERLGLPF